MTFRNYFAGTIFVILLIWGPIDNTLKMGILIRVSYLILVPLTVWLIIGWIWNSWKPNYKTDDILNRILSGVICIILFTLSILEATSKSHIGNSQWISTRDGVEAVGDDVLLQGPSWVNVLLITIIALFVLWYGVLKGNAKSKM